MKSLDRFDNIFVYRKFVDMRKQINGLSIIVEQEMNLDPFESSLFVFTNKRRTLIRMLYWDRTGFAIWCKRLENDRFKWPLHLTDININLNEQKLNWLLDGFDLRHHKTLKYSSIT